MSRITRSQSAFPQTKHADENSDAARVPFRFTRRGSGLGGGVVKDATINKPVTKDQNVRSNRTALGDISNKIINNNEDNSKHMAKKKRVISDEKCDPIVNKEVLQSTSNSENNFKDFSAREISSIDDVLMQEQEKEKNLEDSVAELNLSVDEGDRDDPQSVVEYVNDIMDYMRSKESQFQAMPHYMSRQTDITTRMREILIDWLVEVHTKFKLRLETLYLTVNIIDRFLERRAVSRTKLQLVGCTAMLIASKYEEIYAPEVRDFVYISDKAYTRDQILAMESIMLNTLGFNLTVPSALRFGERFLKVAYASPETTSCAKYLMELTLQESKFLKFIPSTIAASSLRLALSMTTHEKWTKRLIRHTKNKEEDLQECVEALYQLAIKNPPKYKAVRKKYSNKKHHMVSKLTPVNPFA